MSSCVTNEEEEEEEEEEDGGCIYYVVRVVYVDGLLSDLCEDFNLVQCFVYREVFPGIDWWIRNPVATVSMV